MRDGSEEFVALVEKFSGEFDDMSAKRHVMGQEKYGPFKFLEVDALDEMCEELVDIANYARYNFIKLRLMQQSLRAGWDAETDALGEEGFQK